MNFTKNTQAIIYNSQVKAAQRMLDFDFLCGRDIPSVAAFVNPNTQSNIKIFFGQKEILIPEYQTIEEAAIKHPKADVMINFASFRSAYESSKTALENENIKTVAIIAEGIPERLTRKLILLAKEKNKMIIGPATVGGIAAGKFKIGNTAGSISNICDAKLYRAGSVGVVTKSGGLSNEIYNIVARQADGIFEGVAIGGDKFPGSNYMDHLIRYENNPEIKFMVCLGEIGGKDEYEIVDALKKKKLSKPLVIWVSGTCAKVFKTTVQFGHAGAVSGKDEESADAKNEALRNAGAIVPNSFDDFGEKIKHIYNRLRKEGKIKDIKDPFAPNVPISASEAVSSGLVRKETHFTSTISDDRGDELSYCGCKISDIIKQNLGVKDVIGLLWFKKKLPIKATRFIELILTITADHGPAVSGAHNSIVTARAKKDIVSSLASGLLTIGPRFGGAINDAARFFKNAKDSGISPVEFVADMKKKGKYIPGIGHRIKSVQNPDKRVELLKEYCKKNFSTSYLDYALEVEQVTTEKKNNLILNVDGCIAVCFLDMCKSSDFSDEEIDQIVKLGYLNAFFILGRSIGFIGHILDQYRLNEKMYRHPWDDILYDVK